VTGRATGTRRHVETVQHRTTAVTLAGDEFETDARVAEKRVVADGVVTLVLRDLDDRPFPPWTPGAHVDLLLGEARTRQYSLCGDPADHHAWRLGILREAGGESSVHVHDRVQPGDVVRVRGPRNNFPLVESPRYLFIAGGIGITPLLPMIATVDAAGADWSLVYGGRVRSSMAFLVDLARYGGRVSVRPQDEAGLLDLDALLGDPRGDTRVYCCGPEPLLAAVEQRMTAWPAGALHLERFSAPVVERDPADEHAVEVVLAESGRTVLVPPDQSILEALLDEGVDVLHDCQEGICGSCEVKVIDGEVDHRDFVLSEPEKAANGCMMVCVSRACGKRLVLGL
jgi:ferredoxin-NADP reductase